MQQCLSVLACITLCHDLLSISVIRFPQHFFSHLSCTTLKVATRLEEPVFGADSVELTTLPMPTEAKLGSRLTFSPPGRRSLSPSATPTQTMPLFTLALSSSSTPAPPAYEETRMFPPCLTTLHVPSAYSLPIPTPILTPTTIQQSAKVT